MKGQLTLSLVVLVDNVSRRGMIRKYQEAVQECAWNDGDSKHGKPVAISLN
jgi:hypothetical protein